MKANIKTAIPGPRSIELSKKRSATVKALSDCKIGKLKFADIFNICNNHNETGYILMQNISKIITYKRNYWIKSLALSKYCLLKFK